MAYYVPITTEGIKFITDVCTNKGKNNTGNDKLQGRKNIVLPWSIITSTNNLYKSNARKGIFPNKGEAITTNLELATELVSWYNYYCGTNPNTGFDLNANVVAAQGRIESAYTVWAFNSINATGIGQFLLRATWGFILTNATPTLPKFTEEELAVLTNGFVNPLSYYTSLGSGGFKKCLQSDNDSKINRTALYQNMIDNPDLCIKGQARYLRYNADLCNRLAASAVACYFQGHAYAAPTYMEVLGKIPESITSADGKVRYAREDAQKYNTKLFTYLRDDFKLKQLNNPVNNIPNPYQVNVNNSNTTV
jgi:hypothetical protein